MEKSFDGERVKKEGGDDGSGRRRKSTHLSLAR